MSVEIPEQVKELLEEVIYCLGDTATDWLVVKKLALMRLPNQYRRLFSRRNRTTYLHTLNEFDKAFIAYWKEKTGNTLVLDPAKTLSPDWVRRPQGWNLKIINEERRKAKQNEKTTEQ